MSRFFYIIIPIISWLLITFPLWMSPFHPAIVAYFIIAFDLYFFYKSVLTTYYASLSYLKILEINKIDFAKKIKKLKGVSEIKHFVIIPNFQEPLAKLESTLKSIVSATYNRDSLYIILGFEEREQTAQKKAKFLKIKYKNEVKEIISTFHPLVDNEVAGKASNQTYAAKIIDNLVEEKGWDRRKIIVTICDADSHLPNNYFSYLTFQFLTDSKRDFHFYWAPVLLYNNFWQLPFFIRIQATLSSIVRLSLLSYGKNLIQISTYSTNLWLLKKINFWDVDIIPEDWHIYLQAFFTYGDKIRTIPLYTITNGDAVYSGKLIKTFASRYEQEKRWAWGVSDIGYSLKKFFSTPHLDPLVKLKKILFVMETHLLWPTSFFVLTISASIPPLVNPVFKRTVLGFLLPKLSALILTLASSLLVVYVFLDIKLRQKVNQKTSVLSLPLLIVQWYFLPIVSFVLSSLPALDAHTQLLLGKKLEYKVTEKL